MKMLRCYAHGRDGAWEAICVDLDIAVTGRSLEDVQRALGFAIESYVQDAMKESPEDRARLLNRKAPLSVRASYAVRFVLSMLRRPRDKDEGQAGYSLPCPA